jgi:hypothetical protein
MAENHLTRRRRKVYSKQKRGGGVGEKDLLTSRSYSATRRSKRDLMTKPKLNSVLSVHWWPLDRALLFKL